MMSGMYTRFDIPCASEVPLNAYDILDNADEYSGSVDEMPNKSCIISIMSTLGPAARNWARKMAAQEIMAM